MKFQKKKSYKFSVLSLSLLVLINLSFCLMSFPVSAQNLNSSNNFSEDECCHDSNFSNQKNSNNANDTRTLPCCQDHDRATKIDKSNNYHPDSPIFYATVEGKFLEIPILLKNSLSHTILDLPPPEANCLSSVFKKE